MYQNYHNSGRKYDLLLILVLLSALSIIGVLVTGCDYYNDTGVHEDNWIITFIFLIVYCGVSIVLCVLLISNICCNCFSFQIKIVLLVLLTVLMFAAATIVAIRAIETQQVIITQSNQIISNLIQLKYLLRDPDPYDTWLTAIAIALTVGFIVAFIVLLLNLCDKYFYYTQANNVPYPNAIQMNPQTDRYLNNN